MPGVFSYIEAGCPGAPTCLRFNPHDRDVIASCMPPRKLRLIEDRRTIPGFLELTDDTGRVLWFQALE